ncbi:hypothetical protein ACJ4V0_01910 [Phreatobacter sp. HK31-P]
MPKAVSAHSTRRRVLATAAALAIAAPPQVAVACSFRFDPALSLLAAYRQGTAAYNRAPEPATGEACVALIEETFGPAWRQMNEDFPTPTTAEGAAAALRLLVDEAQDFGLEALEIQIASAVLRWIEGGAA